MIFVIGQEYRRREIHEKYGGQRQGGISTPANHPYIFLFTGETGNQYGYQDKPQEDGIFWYTGEGQIGPMEMVRGNRSICEAEANGREIHLFEYVRSRWVRYLGEVTYVGHHYTDAPDREGNLRRVIVFELALENNFEDATPMVEYKQEKFLMHTLRERSLAELRANALASTPSNITTRERRQIARLRSAAIRLYVCKRANGICEGCKQKAPFISKHDNMPYLEPHHIKRLSDGGPDHPLNVIALCPNCHRRIHYSRDGGEYNAYLDKEVARIEEQFSG